MNRISRSARRLALLALAVPLALGLFAGSAAAKYGPGTQVNVMTRNLYLGADLTPAIDAKNTNEFVKANGQILREVTANNFPVRAKGLAQEILKKKPDLVGLQEVALWRTGPPSLEPLLGTAGPTATTVRYDYLQPNCSTQLNKGKKRYRVGRRPARSSTSRRRPTRTASPATARTRLIANAEINGRLTMRDVILARLGAGVEDQPTRRRATSRACCR